MEALSYHSRPVLRKPILVAGFRSGWLDAGDAASGAAQYLRKVWNTTLYASIDTEELYDFTVVRPQARLEDGRRVTVWPTLDVHAGEIPGTDRDALILSGVEPSTRWRTFRDIVMTIARDAEVSTLVTFGAIGSNVPHTRPARVMGIAFDEEMHQRYGLQQSNYQGIVGITSVLAETMRAEGIDVVYLVATIPHYVQTGPSPNGVLALVEAMSQLVHVPVDTDPLTEALAEYRERVQRHVDQDPDVARYVKRLEQMSDEQDVALPTADELAEKFEEFLRDHNDE